MYCRFPKKYLFNVDEVKDLVEYEEIAYRTESVILEEVRKHNCKCKECMEEKKNYDKEKEVVKEGKCNPKEKFEKEETMFSCGDKDYVKDLEKEKKKTCECKCTCKK